MRKIAVILLLILPLAANAQKAKVYVDKIGVMDAVHCVHYFGDSTLTFNFALANTWYHLTNASNNLYSLGEDDGFSISGDTLTFNESGDYDVTGKLAFEGANGVTYNIGMKDVTNVAMIPVASAMTARGAGNVISIPLSAYVQDVTAGDKFILQFRNLDNTSSATLKNSIWKVYKVHD